MTKVLNKLFLMAGILVGSVNGYCSQYNELPGIEIPCGSLDANSTNEFVLGDNKTVNFNLIIGTLPEEYKLSEDNTILNLYATKDKNNKFILYDLDNDDEIEVLPISEGFFKIGSDGTGTINVDDIYQVLSDNVYAKYDNEQYYLLQDGIIPELNKKEVKVIDLRDNDKYFFDEDNIFEKTGKTLNDLLPAVLDLNGNTLIVNNQKVDGNDVPSTVVITQLGTTGSNSGTIDLGENNILSIEPGASVGNGEDNPVTVNNGVVDLCKFFDEDGKLIEGAKISMNFGNNKPVIKLFNENENTLDKLEKVMKNYNGDTLFPNINFEENTPTFEALVSGNNAIDAKIIQKLFNLSEKALEEIQQQIINEDINNDKEFNVIEHVDENNEFKVSDILENLIDNEVLISNGEGTNVILTKEDCQKINEKGATLASVFEDGFKGTVNVPDSLTAEGTLEDPKVKFNVGGISLNIAMDQGGEIEELSTGLESPDKFKQVKINLKGSTLKTDHLNIPKNTSFQLKGGSFVI